MTFLELCQRYRRELSDAGDGPPSVINQSGKNQRHIDDIRDAWMEIQTMRSDWLSPIDANNPQMLEQNGDEPVIDKSLHMAIVWYAVYQRSIGESFIEKYQQAQLKWGEFYQRMLNRYTQSVSFGNESTTY